MRFSIRYKILAVFALLLVTAVTVYTFLASSIFRKEKVALLYDLNNSVAVNAAAQLRAHLIQVGEQVRAYVLSQMLTKNRGLRYPEQFLKEAQVKGVALYEKRGELFVLRNQVNASFKQDSGGVQAALQETLKTGRRFWKVTREAQTHYFLANRLQLQKGDQVQTYVVVSEVDPAPFFGALQSANIFRAYLVEGNGEVLFHLERHRMVPGRSIASHPLLKAAQQRGNVTSGVLSFAHESDRWYGAYAAVGLGNLYFLSQANESEVTSALRELFQRSILFGLIVVTVTFLASILFSKKLTGNLQLLTRTTRLIGQGKFDSQIRIRSRDEVSELASAFNGMVAELKKSREKIERHNRELEETVELRTQQLRETNAQIKEVQEQLVQSSQMAAVGEVAGRTAHEVLNPLTAISSRVDRVAQEGQKKQDGIRRQILEIFRAWEKDFQQGGMEQLVSNLKQASSVKPGVNLLEEDLSNLNTLVEAWNNEQKGVTSDLAFVQEQAQRIQRIVDQMRTLVRSSSHREKVDGHVVLKEAANTMRDFFEKYGIEVELAFEASERTLVLNRDEFVQAVTNLLRNAYQAIESRRNDEPDLVGRVDIRTFNESARFCVDVIDNGIGIEPAKQARIFDTGFTTKSTAEGTGLGLAICRRYVRAVGGDVRLLLSKKSQTCFRIELPLEEAAT